MLLKCLLIAIALPGLGLAPVARQATQIAEEDDVVAAKAVERRAQPVRVVTAERPRVATPKRPQHTKIEATPDACARMHVKERPRRSPPPEPPSLG